MIETSDLSLRDGLSKRRTTRWLKVLGLVDAKVPTAGVQTSLEFFRNRMSTLPVEMAVNFLSAMDLSRPVQELTLQPGAEIIAFRSQTECEFKLFYAWPGASRHSSGLNAHGRVAVRYTVTNKTAALDSYTTSAIDVSSGPPAFRR